MTHPNKVKGNSFERELVNDAKAHNLDAERAYASNGKSLGESEEVDLLVDVYRIQAKRRKKLPAYLQVPEGCDAVAFRQDRGDTLILLTWEEFLHLVQQIKEKQ